MTKIETLRAAARRFHRPFCQEDLSQACRHYFPAPTRIYINQTLYLEAKAGRMVRVRRGWYIMP